MTARLRLLIAAAPLLTATALAFGSRCTDAAHSLFLYMGVVHADAGCASGTALGPSMVQAAGLTAIVLITVLGSSAAVREAVDALVERLAHHVDPVLMPQPAPVTADYSRRLTWGSRTGAGSRDPPCF